MSLNYSDMPPDLAARAKNVFKQFTPSKPIEPLDEMMLYHHIRKVIYAKGLDMDELNRTRKELIGAAPSFIKSDPAKVSALNDAMDLAISDYKAEQNVKGAWEVA